MTLVINYFILEQIESLIENYQLIMVKITTLEVVQTIKMLDERLVEEDFAERLVEEDFIMLAVMFKIEMVMVATVRLFIIVVSIQLFRLILKIFQWMLSISFITKEIVCFSFRLYLYPSINPLTII
jgi:hypothetical protein